jgi:hypothetical protein
MRTRADPDPETVSLDRPLLRHQVLDTENLFNCPFYFQKEFKVSTGLYQILPTFPLSFMNVDSE